MNKYFVFLSCLAIAFATCQSTSSENQKSSDVFAEKIFSYPPTVLPKDTTKLWWGSGSLENDTVLIDCAGGPKTHLDFNVEGRTSWEYLPRFEYYYRVHLHQAQTYNKKMFEYDGEFTLEMAKVEIEHTAEMLNRAIQYFKSRGKTVIVIAHSYGAFIAQDYLTKYPSMADKYIISAGRIIPNAQQNEYFLRGINKNFQEDGLTLNPPDDDDGPNPGRSERYYKIYQVKQMLKAAYNQIPFPELLADVDLSNVIYVYATNDQNVGALTEPEIEFLESKNVQLHATSTGHYGNWKRIIDKVRSGEIVL